MNQGSNQEQETHMEYLFIGIAIIILVLVFLYYTTPYGIIPHVYATYFESIIYDTVTLGVIPPLHYERLQLKELLEVVSNPKFGTHAVKGQIDIFISENIRITPVITRLLIIIPSVICCIWFVRREKTYKKLLYICPSPALPPKGVTGFLSIIGKHIPKEIEEQCRNTPTPEVLKEAFRYARLVVNIPPNLVGRCFGKYTPERLAILDYGRVKEIDRDFIAQITDIEKNKKEAISKKEEADKINTSENEKI